MSEESPEKKQRTISLTTRQAGMSVGVAGLLLALQPFIKSMIQDENKTFENRIVSMESAIEAHIRIHEIQISEFKETNKEATTTIVARMEKGWDDVARRIESAEARLIKVTDHQQKQIDELIALKYRPRNNY